jgi:hypothetical protein
MLVHFLNNYDVIGKAGNKIRIIGEFPGIQTNDFVYLHKGDEEHFEELQAFKIEHIEYHEAERKFKAVAAEYKS